MQVIRRAELLLTPWKNGGGLTREIYMCRDGAGQSRWRISMALVESSGPFSRYCGVTRVLAVVRGDPLRLLVDGEAQLLAPLQPVTFSGDADSAGELTGGPLEDFNVMAWPGVRPRVQIAPASQLGIDGVQALVALDDGLYLQRAGESVALNYGDAVILPAEESGILLSGTGMVAAVWTDH